MKDHLKTVKLADVRLRFYVRQALDQDRVDMFCKMYKTGSVKLPPIILGKLPNEEDLILVDGRTRRHARELAGYDDVDAIVRQYENMADMIIDAFKANVGGAMPPSQADILHTLDILLEKGVSRRAIVEDICAGTGYPPVVMRRYLDDIQAARTKRRMAAAVQDVANGEITVADAARKHDVDAGGLRRAITGKKKEDKPATQQLISGVSSRYVSHSQKNAAFFKGIASRIDEGNLSKKDLEKIMKHFRKLIERESKMIIEWDHRLSAKFQ